MKIIALIPASLNSRKLKNKDIYNFNGHPLLAYTISSAIQSGIFSSIVCVTDNFIYGQIAKYYGASVPVLYPKNFLSEDQSNREWVSWALSYLINEGASFDAFATLGPTNPFRMPEMIQRAWAQFSAEPKTQTVQSVEKLLYSQESVWKIEKGTETLYSENSQINESNKNEIDSTIAIFAKNCCIEIHQTSYFLNGNKGKDDQIQPFLTDPDEGFMITSYQDVLKAEYNLSIGKQVPSIDLKSYLMDNI